jgi:cell division septation protein DedD
MENQNPVVFPEGQVNAPVVTPTVQVVQTTDPNVQPFKNNVNSYPEATEDNGVKADEAGVSFKVQIGAFSKQVPNEVAANFMKIKTWPVEYKQINGLFVYNVGNFSNAAAAKAFKNELVQLGITDAFVVVYRDGSKIYGAEASNLLSR